jgi:hypothetical protein
MSSLVKACAELSCVFRDGILWHQFNERLESFLHAIHSPFYWSTDGFQRKPYSSLVLKILTKKSAKQEKQEKHFVVQKNKGRKPDINPCLKRLEFMPRNSTKMQFKNSIPVCKYGRPMRYLIVTLGEGKPIFGCGYTETIKMERKKLQTLYIFHQL